MESAKGTIHLDVATEDKAEDGFGFLQSKSNDPRLHDQAEREQLNPDHLYLEALHIFIRGLVHLILTTSERSALSYVVPVMPVPHSLTRKFGTKSCSTCG